MEISQNSEGNQFEVRQEGHLAVLQYRLHRGSMYIMHTKVPEELSGKGIGSELAKTVLEYAKEQEIPIVVYCPFVKDYLEKNPEYKSLLLKKQS